MRKLYSLVLTLLLAFISIALAEEKPYIVFLKPKSVLTRLSDQSSFTIERGVYAKVLETNTQRRDLFIVYDKTGKPVYQTSAEGVEEIAGDINILPQIDAEVTYPPPSTYKAYNQFALLDTQFNLHLDNLQTSALDRIYSQELGSARSNRYEVRTLFVSELPVNFGVALNYQAAVWENDVDQVNLSILSLGPHLQRYIYHQNRIALSIHFAAEYAPIYRTSSGASTENFMAILYDLGVEALWETSYGKWSLGSHYRRHDLTLNSTTRVGVNPIPETIIMNSIGAMIGYKYEWSL